MDFYSRQEAAHRASWLLRAHYLVVAVLTLPTLFVATTLVLTAATTLAEALFRAMPFVDDEFRFLLAPLVPIVSFAIGSMEPFGAKYVWTWACIDVLATLGMLALWSVGARRSNDRNYRAHVLRAEQAGKNSADPEERQFVNIVEEMALASGIPAPDVCVWGQTVGINAFVVGSGSSDAVLFVSRGALALLNREETQALVAHELGRITHGDVAINDRMTSFNFLVLLALGLGVGLLILPSQARTGTSLVVLGIVWLICLPFALLLTVIGFLPAAAALLLQYATMRQRQKLADAYAVQFTRNPLALRNVLMKVAVHGGLPGGAATDYRNFEHSCFASVARRRWLNPHPPLEERLRALDPGFGPDEFQKFSAEEKERARGIKIKDSGALSPRLRQDAAARRRVLKSS